ncbi:MULTISPECIES: hypothetical protein [unclassified Roseateles]|uniref:hypothetical protein n=1 Tax=unclassified Roseateles TaxID=2626991 RepID=UPI0006FC8F72|nr:MULTISPECIES: hypothetical protein [unclassified Roseateles]KQW44855.1 hypothetical protein ASC81_14925 [Pelomonas sp. Root405]KRA70214.1 hypothetical protein ASD88_19085 [Pelomonas sp. Root662]
MNAVTSATTSLLTQLDGLLRGLPGSTVPLANTLSVQALGVETFGRTDALDLFARHPLVLSPTPHVLAAPGALMVLDVTPEGRAIGVFADVADGVLTRLWVVGATADDAMAEPGVPVASDDFLSQDRSDCAGDPQDHPHLGARAWPQVQAGAAAALQSLPSMGEPAAASSSRAVVVRAFSSEDSFAALYTLRVLQPGVPRQAHRRWALVAGRIGADGSLLHRRLAVSDPWPVPAPVLF